MENENPRSLRATLELRRHTKPIPYPAVERETSSNHGFKVLKDKLEEISLIPEAMDNQNIINVLKVLNNGRSPFFSVGCEKAFNHDANFGYWVRGFIEFSFNYVGKVQDAQSYFKVFFEFNNFLWKINCNLPVMFHWEIDRAVFVDANDCGGFTCAVWITTYDFPTEQKAKTTWEQSLRVLTDFFALWEPINDDTKIY